MTTMATLLNYLFFGINTSNTGSSGVITLIMFLSLAAGMIQLFEMAFIPKWKAIVPIYNIWTLAKIIKVNPLTIIMFFVPVLDIIYTIYFMNKLSKAYDRGILMTVALIICSPIAIIVMAFSDKTQYRY